MSRETAEALSFGTLVVASLLFFTAFVVFLRSDLDNPLVAAATFASLGAVVLVLRALVRRTHRNQA